MNRKRETPRSTVNAVVLGGCGPVGAAWTSALLHGLRSADIPLAECDVVQGTSAGAVVAAWLTMRPDNLPALPERMRERAAWHAENAKAGRGDHQLLRRMTEGHADDREAARSIGQAAIAAIPPISADQAEALWKSSVPEGPWPAALGVVAVNAGTGTAHVWSAKDDIPLAIAVSSSTAAPGAAPPVAVADAVWVDGGVRTATNADLLVDAEEGPDRAADGAGPGRVLIVAPLPADDLAREEAVLVGRGHRVRVIVADPFYDKPTDLLDPRFIDIATAAGARQAHELTADLTAWWDR
jgi:NTE family protein